MLVTCAANTGRALPATYLVDGYSVDSIFQVVIGKDYPVFAMVLWKSRILLLLSDESELPNYSHGILGGQVTNTKDDGRREDPVQWARAETIRFAKHKAKRYGALTLVNVGAIVMIAKGMPAHSLWPILSLPLLLCFGCLFTATSFHSVALFNARVDGRKPHR